MKSPAISIIIPTHNRRLSLARTLKSLPAQSNSNEEFEVIVVADGCTDDTVSYLRALSLPFTIRVFETPGTGAATARNFGAAQAATKLLLFLDDDIKASSTLVDAHAAAHKHLNRRVVIGYLPPVFDGKPDFFQIGLRCWWEEQFREMQRGGHRFSYRDLLSGNFSVPTWLFREIGGFNESLKCREDYELGYRLIKANTEFVFCREAMGYHFDESTLPRSLRRVAEEGRGDVQIGRCHPELRSSLLLARMDEFNSRQEQLAHHLAFRNTTLGDALAGLLLWNLMFFERIRHRRKWRENFKRLRHYWYWRGVASELKTRASLAEFLQRVPIIQATNELEIDLKRGIESAEALLDAVRPDAAFVHYGETPIGHIALVPGAEPLRGEHLRPTIFSHFSKQTLFALAMHPSNAAGASDKKSMPLEEEACAH